jgi:hypothetical protein
MLNWNELLAVSIVFLITFDSILKKCMMYLQQD